MLFQNDANRIAKVRFDFLYSFSNCVVIFRSKKPEEYSDDSKGYDIIAYSEHDCRSMEDCLFEISSLVEINEVDLRHYDVIGVKLNGVISCYRYYGRKKKNDKRYGKSYRPINDFVTAEKNNYITKLHEEDKVLSVLDGKEYSVDEIDPEQQKVYAIEGEAYTLTLKDNREFVTMDYSLYCIEKMVIKKVNPYERPFYNVQSAMNQFDSFQSSQKGKSPLLLFSRKELFMLKDYRQLMRSMPYA